MKLFTAAEVGYMSSFSEAILEDVVSVLPVSFSLAFHNIVLSVNKPLSRHDRVTDSMWACFLLDKENREISLCGMNLKEPQSQKTSPEFLEKKT